MGEEVFVPGILFGAIVGIVWLVSYFNSRKRNTISETMRHSLDKGQPLSEDMWALLLLGIDPARADLRRGVLFIAAGLAFAFLAWMIGMEEGEAVRPMLGVAAFPVFLGLAYLGLWVSARNERKA